MSNFNSPFLKNLESLILKYLNSDKPFSISMPDGTQHEFTQEEMLELQKFFKEGSMTITIPNTSQAVSIQKVKDDKFRREIERILFKSIYPSTWQIGVLIRELNMLLKWKDKRQRAIITFYEPYINKALISLNEKKRKQDEKIGWPDDLGA